MPETGKYDRYPNRGGILRMMAERSLGCIQDLAARHPHDKIAVVTHGGPLSIF